MNEQSTLVIKIDKELHKQIKATCVINEISIKDYIITLVEKDMKERNNEIKKK